MKVIGVLLLIAIAVGVFMVVGNTHKDAAPEQQVWQYVCSQADSGCARP